MNQRHPLFSPGPRGFVLIDLIFTLAILGILAATVMPHFADSISRAQLKQCMASRATMENAANRYMFEKETLNPAMRELVAAEYLYTEPRCTAGGTYVWMNDATISYPYRSVMCSLHGYTQSASTNTGSGSTGEAPPPSELGFSPYANDFSSDDTSWLTRRSGGQWKIDDGILRPASNMNSDLIIPAINAADYTVQVIANVKTDNKKAEYRVYYRATWDANGTANLSGYYFEFKPSTGLFVVNKVTAGAVTQIASSAMPGSFSAVDTAHTVAVSVQGASHSVKVDATTVLSFTDKTFASGLTGLGTTQQDLTFDDLSVKPL